MADKDTDEITGTPTTGHEWDGIRELNTPLPRWWVWTFYATIVWAIGYTIAYPAWPLVSDATKGVLGWTSRGAVVEQISAAKAGQAKYLDRINELPVAEIREDSDLLFFAMAGGRSAFAVNCSPCHGSGAAGGPGYPNLNDDDWIWGGTPETIEASIRHGIRYDADSDTRVSDMPAFGRDELLDGEQIGEAAEFVLSLAGLDHDAAAAETGAAVFKENCVACHGDQGGGDPEFGAPALNDAIWLYGSSKDQIVSQINAPRHGVMPAWGGRLDEATIKQLAIYVHGLGGGE